MIGGGIDSGMGSGGDGYGVRCILPSSSVPKNAREAFETLDAILDRDSQTVFNGYELKREGIWNNYISVRGQFANRPALRFGKTSSGYTAEFAKEVFNPYNFFDLYDIEYHRFEPSDRMCTSMNVFMRNFGAPWQRLEAECLLGTYANLFGSTTHFAYESDDCNSEDPIERGVLRLKNTDICLEPAE